MYVYNNVINSIYNRCTRDNAQYKTLYYNLFGTYLIINSVISNKQKGKNMKQKTREHFTKLINARLQREFETNECQCDDCGTGITYNGYCGIYHGQEIVHIQKVKSHSNVKGHLVWCFFSDIKRSTRA